MRTGVMCACNFGACVRHASNNGVAWSVLLQRFEIQIYLQSMTSVSGNVENRLKVAVLFADMHLLIFVSIFYSIAVSDF